MIHESPESIVKTTRTHPVGNQAAGTSDLPATPIANTSKGNLKVTIDHGATAAGHTLDVSILHRDPGGAYAIATDAGGNPMTVSVAASQAADVLLMRCRSDRLKAEVAIRSVVVGGSGVDVSIVAEQFGLDSADCDGAAGYAFLDA